MQKHFHHYFLTEQLASKPLQSIYLAHHINDPLEQVVIKIFDATYLNIEQESKNLLQRVESIKQLKHTHILPVLDLGIEQAQPYIISKYLPSGSLRHRLDHLSSQSLDLQDALPIIFQVGQALRYAHQHNILHGNIKPENIFFNEQGKALLGDFRGRAIKDTSLDIRNNPNIEDNGIYTLTFSSSIPNQVLTVKYTMKTSDTSNGYIMLEAATLQD